MNRAGNVTRGVAIVRIHRRPDQRSWIREAACQGHDPGHWYPANDVRADKQARRICADCPVRQDCLDYALAAAEPRGMWGGVDWQDRCQNRREAS